MEILFALIQLDLNFLNSISRHMKHYKTVSVNYQLNGLIDFLKITYLVSELENIGEL
jgi:hypothetical protein